MVRQFGWICLALCLFAVAAETGQAQLLRGRQVFQTPLRWLGQGNGPGNHQCNPGPDVSYYNPWTRKNSMLISQTPQFFARYGHEQVRTPEYLLYTGESPFAPDKPGPESFRTNQAFPSTLDADFVPSSPQSNDSDEAEKEQGPEADSDDSDDDEEFGSLPMDFKGNGIGASLKTPSSMLPASHSIRFGNR